MLLSRRTLLAGVGAGLAGPVLQALQDPAQYGLQALLNDVGFVTIKAGEFAMGSRNGSDDERPVHQVRISRAFQIGRFEVTQSQWETVMRNPHANPSPDQDAVSATPSHFKGAGLPVESVSWDDIQKFLERLNARAGEFTFRLPTEAEWEYACRSGSADDAAGSWSKENSGGTTQPIGQKKPNRLGIYDATGNVAEWVQDWYDADYYSASPHVDPKGPDTGSYRVFRGGSWLNEAKYCRASIRTFDFPNSRFYNVGLRLVRMLKQA